MSIIIDTDLTALMQHLNISEMKMRKQYATKTVEEIIELEAEAGNQEAVNYARELFDSPTMLVKIFKLADPKNKIEILKEMNLCSLKEFLPIMEEEDLNQGLFFFEMNKLLQMIEELPPDQLVKIVMEMFSEKAIIEYLPEEQLDKFLDSTDLDKNQIIKHMKNIPQEYLAQMYEAVSGESGEELNSQQIIDKINNFSPLKFKDSLHSMQPHAKQLLTLNIASENKELYENFEARAYTNMINEYKFQPELAQSMAVIEPEHKINMLGQLPEDLLSIVITQIDAEVFAEQLIKNNPELLAQIIMK